MAAPLDFSKYHGLGNDFLLVYGRQVSSDEAVVMCDRHFGAGADGLILIGQAEAADFSFLLYNSDGSVAEVSGNGMRCVGKFLYEKGHHADPVIKVEAGGKIKTLELQFEGEKVTGVQVDMGLPDRQGEIKLYGRTWKKVATGNPHAVTFVDDINTAPVSEFGPLVENDPAFRNRTNVEFVQVEGDELHVRFWERGVGVTLASGSGSCAAAAASDLDRAIVHTLGGDLLIEKDPAGRLLMTGPAVHVYDAVWMAS